MISNHVDEFFNNDEFSYSAEYTPKGGSAISILANFYAPGTTYDAGDVQVMTTEPRAEVKTADVNSAVAGDTIEIDGIIYNVVNAEPSGYGITLLDLSND